MQKSRWLIILAAAAAILVLAGCGGGSSSKDKTATVGAGGGAQSSGNATKSSGQGEATKAPEKTQEATKTSNSSSSGGSADWDAMKKKFLKSTFHASYKVTGSGSDQFAEGGMQLFKDGDKRFRFDITAKQDGKDVAIIFIQKDDASAFCLKDAAELGALLGIEPGKGVCFKSDPNDPNNPAGSLSSTFGDIENDDSTVLETSKKQVAGHDATCFRLKDNKTNDVSTPCFASDGSLLYVKTEGADASEIEATDLSTSVGGGDFDLPYEVRDFPSFGGDTTPAP
jgi:hypothetical protein